MLTLAIRAYRRYRLVKQGVRLAIRVHHTVRPRPRGRCHLAGNCSAIGLAESREISWRALPGILARVEACQYAGQWRWANPDDC
jgi:hypothetical protein